MCILLNWNGWRDTIPCIDSLQLQDYPSLSILVVDNRSTDDSVLRIRAAAPSVEVLIAESNRGFGAGCNLGIAEAMKRKADLVWLLNNDTLVPPDTCSKLVRCISDSQAGLVGSVLRYMHNPSAIQAWGGGRINRVAGISRHFLAPAALDRNSYLTFASVMVRSAVFTDIGLIDEHFFMYFEDADFCFRAFEAGWKLAVAGDTEILHKEGGSSPKGPSRAKERMSTESGMYFLRRHGRPRFLAPFLYLLTRIGKRTVRFDIRGIEAVLQGARNWARSR